MYESRFSPNLPLRLQPTSDSRPLIKGSRLRIITADVVGQQLLKTGKGQVKTVMVYQSPAAVRGSTPLGEDVYR